MTPAEYFALHPTACQPAQDFCRRFATMREAWLSDECEVGWMLWVLGRDDANRQGIVEFARFFADRAKSAAYAYAYAAAADAARSAAYAYAYAYADAAAAADAARSAAYADAAAYAADAARSAAAAYAAAAYAALQSQRDKLRELFPIMFQEMP